MKTFYQNRYASIEMEADGSWTLFNDVTGLVVEAGLKFPQAFSMMKEFNITYGTVEFGRFQS